MKGSEKYFGLPGRPEGRAPGAQYADFDNGKMFLAQQFRDPDTGAWVELFRNYAKDRVLTQIVGFTTDPHVILTASTEGGDKTGIYEYDIKQRKIIEPAFEHKLFEASRRDHLARSRPTSAVRSGSATTPTTAQHLLARPGMAALQKAADQALGVPTVTGRLDRSRHRAEGDDPGRSRAPASASSAGRTTCKSIVLEKSGPKQPPEYYLLADGKLTLLGKARPWIDAGALGDTKLVEYPARDGLLIPAFLTLPPAAQFGPGPYPTLIEPHGGPWARD